MAKDPPDIGFISSKGDAINDSGIPRNLNQPESRLNQGSSFIEKLQSTFEGCGGYQQLAGLVQQASTLCSKLVKTSSYPVRHLSFNCAHLSHGGPVHPVESAIPPFFIVVF
ncbi:MAG TPA: hypothetical protein PLL06_04950 [Acidobacteriota bacterium]|nr:hypothetical protein [Acidobacteriota bacterium]HNB72141.1 hypothetical protein [Acidobacteriota bacterium]HNC44453.1 hypothetical protein [Acidobacteriota bacterium]